MRCACGSPKESPPGPPSSSPRRHSQALSPWYSLSEIRQSFVGDDDRRTRALTTARTRMGSRRVTDPRTRPAARRQRARWLAAVTRRAGRARGRCATRTRPCSSPRPAPPAASPPFRTARAAGWSRPGRRRAPAPGRRAASGRCRFSPRCRSPQPRAPRPPCHPRAGTAVRDGGGRRRGRRARGCGPVRRAWRGVLVGLGLGPGLSG